MDWLKQFLGASKQTKWFIFNWVFYGIVIVVTLIWCYGRLDFVRSGPPPATHTQQP